MQIVDVTPENRNDYLVCLEEWSEEMRNARRIKEKWFERMKDRGLRAKLAVTDEGVAGGMIEMMPIEHSYAQGKDLYIVNCIWVHGYEGKGRGNLQGKGLGVALLKAAEEEVLAMGKKGLAAWGLSEPFWMSASWFEKHGYERADREDWRVLVWKRFAADAMKPTWIRGEFTQEPVPGKVKVTAFFSGQCPSENSAYLRAKRAAEAFGERVVFEEVDMSAVENRRKYGLHGGIYVGGENLFTGPPPSLEQIREKIEEKFKTTASP